MRLQIQTPHNHQQDAYTRFMYGIKSDETRRSYVSKLEYFFDFYKIEGKDIKLPDFTKADKMSNTHKSLVVL
jgi:predicted phosphoadenosine phosphosulfate sulfurtransferase